MESLVPLRALRGSRPFLEPLDTSPVGVALRGKAFQKFGPGSWQAEVKFRTAREVVRTPGGSCATHRGRPNAGSIPRARREGGRKKSRAKKRRERRDGREKERRLIREPSKGKEAPSREATARGATPGRWRPPSFTGDLLSRRGVARVAFRFSCSADPKLVKLRCAPPGRAQKLRGEAFPVCGVWCMQPAEAVCKLVVFAG